MIALAALLLVQHHAVPKINQGFDASRIGLIPLRMKEFVSRGDVAGTVVLIQRHGKTVLFDAQGFANLEDKRPMRTDTIFQVMSMTKPITAIAVVMCAERGLLNLEDPVEKYLPSFKSLKVEEEGKSHSPKVRLTIRHLLTHTGGLSGTDPAGLDDEAKQKLRLSTYVDLVPTAPLVGDPGSAIRYSGLGFSTLGRIVEVVSKQSLENFMRLNIFEPLKMSDTGFFAQPEKHSRIASVYVRSENGLVPLEPDPFRKGAVLANPAGGLYSTAEDMAKLLTCVSQGGAIGKVRLLSPAAVDAMTHVQTGTLQMDGSDAQGFGLGFSVVKSAAGQMSLKPVGSFGHSGAFGTEYWTDPKTGIVAVFMAQGLDNTTTARKTFNTMVNAAFIGP